MYLTALCKLLPQYEPKEGAEALWLPLIPKGKVQGMDGRNWNNYNPHAIMANTTLPLILDIDHASETTANTAASGWFTELKIEDGQILGKLELNDKGQTAINNKHYKYYSPAFTFNKNTKNILRLVSVGLTNKPNLDVPALNSQQTTTTKEEPKMDEIIQLLGLEQGADEAAIVAAIKALLSKAESKEPALNNYVPRATYEQTETALNAANARLAEIEQQKHNEAVDVAINSALEGKKIAPADVDYYRSQCSTEDGLKAFNSFIETKAPLIGEASFKNPPKAEKTALNSDQQNILAQLNLTAEDIQGE